MITYIYLRQGQLSWQSVIYVFAEARPSATILSAITRRCKSTCSSSELLSVAPRVHAKKCRNTAMSTWLCPMGCVHRIAIFGNMTIHQWIFGVLVTTMLSGQATCFLEFDVEGSCFWMWNRILLIQDDPSQRISDICPLALTRLENLYNSRPSREEDMFGALWCSQRQVTAVVFLQNNG